jgi:hypothetical protein
MHYHNLSDMANAAAFALSKKKKSEDTRAVIYDAIRDHWIDKVALVWSVTDVKETAAKLGVRLTKAECRDVLLCLFHDHDASVGVSWDTIESAVRRAAERKARK